MFIADASDVDGHLGGGGGEEKKKMMTALFNSILARPWSTTKQGVIMMAKDSALGHGGQRGVGGLGVETYHWRW